MAGDCCVFKFLRRSVDRSPSLVSRWLDKYYSPPSSRRKTKWLPVSNKVTLKQVKLLFGLLVFQLVWYILKQLFTSVSVKVVDFYLAAARLDRKLYPPLFTSTSVNNCYNYHAFWTRSYLPQIVVTDPNRNSFETSSSSQIYSFIFAANYVNHSQVKYTDREYRAASAIYTECGLF